MTQKLAHQLTLLSSTLPLHSIPVGLRPLHLTRLAPFKAAQSPLGKPGSQYHSNQHFPVGPGNRSGLHFVGNRNSLWGPSLECSSIVGGSGVGFGNILWDLARLVVAWFRDNRSSSNIHRSLGRTLGRMTVVGRKQTLGTVAGTRGVGGTLGAPAGTLGAPAGTLGAPAGTLGAPAGTLGAPAGTLGAPAGTLGAPAGTLGAPAGTLGAPVATLGAPVATLGAPVATLGAPVATLGAPVATLGAPVATLGAPVPTLGAPVPTLGAPVPTLGAPVPTLDLRCNFHDYLHLLMARHYFSQEWLGFQARR
jgi:hypothetical protein